MAAYVGRNGFVSLSAATSGTLTYVDSFTLNANIGTADITAYGDSARAYAHTIRDASFSLTATLDRGDTEWDDVIDQFDGSSTKLTAIPYRLYAGTTEYWAGQALLTGLTVNSAVGDKVGITLNAVCNSISYITTGATT
jgi:hypothetical protein